jgi:hypothetical protein
MSEQTFHPKVDPGPGMVSWLTYLDSRLLENSNRISDLDRRGEEQRVSIQERLDVRSAVVDKRLDHFESRFDKLEDLLRDNTRDTATTREEMARNGVIATAVAAFVSVAARYLGV